MNIEFPAKLSGARADLVKGVVVLAAQVKLADLDDDAQDNLGELVNLHLGADVCIAAAEHGNLDLSCFIEGFRGNLAEGIAVVSIKVPRSEITLGGEELLRKICKLELDVSVNIMNRQMNFSDYKSRVEIKTFNNALRGDT